MRNTVSAFALLLATACATNADIEDDSIISTAADNIAKSSTAKTLQKEIIRSESEKLNTFFEEQFDAAVARSPMFQTSLGLKTNKDKWDDPSEAAALEEFELGQAAIEEMKSLVDYDKLSPDTQLSYRLFKLRGKQSADMFAYRHHGYVFDQMYGQQSRIPAFLIAQHRVSDKQDAISYIARLNGVKDYLGTHLENAQNAAMSGIRPPKFVYEYVLSDIENVISGAPFTEGEDSPLFTDIKSKINKLKISDDEKINLILDANAALLTSVLPAYKEVESWIKEDIELASNDDGAWKLPNGGDYYKKRLARMTTTDLTADQIHELGLSEVARIHDEMKAIMEKVEYEGTLSEFFEFMRLDEQFYYSNDHEGRSRYIKEATALIDTMREVLPKAFNTFPEAEMVVRRVESFREKSAGKAFYQRPAQDGSRPGVYYANLFRMSSMPIYQMEALAYHEGIPGHHMQLAIAQELQNVPKFGKYGGFTAYTEGWGLYSEYLPKEMGFYQDPYSDFGRLAMELWRAARLVVDTGIHEKKWTREQATQYLMDNTPNPEGDCIKAIDRYIVMPGQATAYKIGMIKILELREKAKAEMGEAFNLPDFHDVVLASGPVPLSELEHAIDSWIEKSRP